MSPRLFTIYALGILGVWALSFVVSALSRDYTLFTIATTVMLAITGGIITYFRPKNGGKS